MNGLNENFLSELAPQIISEFMLDSKSIYQIV